MPRFQKKSVVVEAEQFWPDKKPWPKGVTEALSKVCEDPQCDDSTWDHECTLGMPTGTYWIGTSLGRMTIYPGWWIMTNAAGGIGISPADSFEATYEPVDESADPNTIARQTAEQIHGTKPTTSPEGELWEIAVEVTTEGIQATIDKAVHAAINKAMKQSAAPELLEACQAFVEAWEQCLQLEKTDVALKMAKAAIDKALQESPPQNSPDLLEACKLALSVMPPCNPQWSPFDRLDECPAGHKYECGDCHNRRIVQAAINKAEQALAEKGESE